MPFLYILYTFLQVLPSIGTTFAIQTFRSYTFRISSHAFRRAFITLRKENMYELYVPIRSILGSYTFRHAF